MNKSIIAASITGLIIFAGSISNAQIVTAPEPPAPAPAIAPDSAPAATTSFFAQSALDQCNADLRQSKGSYVTLEKSLEDCTTKLKAVTGTTTTPPPKKAVPVTCELPDGSVIKLLAGKDCDCLDPDYVAVVKVTGHAKVCVARKVAIVKLDNRITALEAIVGPLSDLRAQFVSLQVLEGQHFNALLSQLNAIVDRLNELKGDVDGLKKEVADLATKLAAIEGRVTKLEDHPQPSQLAHLTGTVGGAWAGGVGPDFRIGGHFEYENRISKSNISVVAGAGAAVAAAHTDSTYGTRAFPSVDLSARIYTTDKRVLGIDLGAEYIGEVMLSHGAGYRGLPSQGLGREVGPMVGIFFRPEDSAFHVMFHCSLPIGPRNYLDGDVNRRDTNVGVVCTAGAGWSIF